MKRRIVSFLLAIVLLSLLSTAFAAAKYSGNGIQNNGLGGITINIYADPFTKFATATSWGQYAYGSQGCAWFASARLNQLTGKDPGGTIWSGQSWYNDQYANYGFSRGTSARTNEKQLVCFENHVGVIETITSDGKWIISEGGAGQAGSTYDYCRLSAYSSIDEYVNMVKQQHAFKGYVYLGVPFPDQDSSAPTITNVKVTDISINGYTVSCDVKDNKGVTTVAFPTWTELNGQDDLANPWPSVAVNSGANVTKTVTYRVNSSDHNGEKGVYITHIYAYDAAGNSVKVSQTQFSSLRVDLAASIKESSKLKLPVALTRIEEEAFLNTKAEAVVIPDSVKYIGSKAFPANMVVYMSTGVARTVASDAMVGAYIIDTTEYSDWSSWSAWSTARQSVTNSNLMQEESRTVYPYYCFRCPTCGYHSPYWGSSANHSHTISSSDFAVNLDEITTPKSSCANIGNGKYQATYNGENWYYWDDGSSPDLQQPKVQYRYRTRTVLSK